VRVCVCVCVYVCGTRDYGIASEESILANQG